MKKNKVIKMKCGSCGKEVDYFSKIIENVCVKCAQKTIKLHSCDFCKNLFDYDCVNESYIWYGLHK